MRVSASTLGGRSLPLETLTTQRAQRGRRAELQSRARALEGERRERPLYSCRKAAGWRQRLQRSVRRIETYRTKGLAPSGTSGSSRIAIVERPACVVVRQSKGSVVLAVALLMPTAFGRVDERVWCQGSSKRRKKGRAKQRLLALSLVEGVDKESEGKSGQFPDEGWARRVEVQTSR